MEYNLTTPLTKEKLEDLRAGDYVLITGILYAARDAAHKRMHEALAEGRKLPIEIRDAAIYYMGPTPGREGRPLGSAGPTTSARMDQFTPELFELGLSCVIGKGRRSALVNQSAFDNGCVYFAAEGGAGALLSQCVITSEIVAYEDLGTEAIRRLTVKNFPVIVITDTAGNNLYDKVYARIPEDLR